VQFVLASLVLLALFIAGSTAKSYSNPVEARHGMADPGVFWDPKLKLYVAVTTGGSNFPIFTSPDLATWKSAGHVFTDATKPKWASEGYWAPEIIYNAAHKEYVCIFSAKSKAKGAERLGIAFAKSVFGPWKDDGKPFFDMPGQLEVIDGSIFHDPKSKKFFLYWKSRGGGGTTLWAREMKSNLRGFAKGSRNRLLLKNTLPWEGFTIEGPNVLFRKGVYYLFYSGNTCCQGVHSKYRVGVARSKKPLGPFAKKKEAILKESANFVGPGHGTVLTLHSNPKRTVFVYHAYVRGHLAKKFGNDRYLMLDTISAWKRGWPVFRNSKPSSGPTKLPA